MIAQTTLRGGVGALARLAWVCFCLPTLGLAAAGFAIAYMRPEAAARDTIIGALAVAGPPLVVTMTLGVVLPMVFYAGAGILLFVRKGSDWVALLTSFAFIVGGAAVTRPLAVLADEVPGTRWAVRLVWTGSLASAAMVAFLFPSGRFVPRWTRWAAVAVVPLLAVFRDLPVMAGRADIPAWPDADWNERSAVVAVITFAVLGISVQAMRYRAIVETGERIRMRRMIWSATAFLGLITGTWALRLVAAGLAHRLLPLIVLVGVAPALLFSLSAIDVVVRGGLFDMEVIANRTLVFGGVVALLGAGYLGAIFVFNLLFKPLTGGSDIAIASATLCTAAIFRPIFRRVQRAVERRFNRARYDAIRTIDLFNLRLRRQIDLDAMGAELVEVVRRTMQPSNVSLWLRSKA